MGGTNIMVNSFHCSSVEHMVLVSLGCGGSWFCVYHLILRLASEHCNWIRSIHLSRVGTSQQTKWKVRFGVSRKIPAEGSLDLCLDLKKLLTGVPCRT